MTTSLRQDTVRRLACRSIFVPGLRQKLPARSRVRGVHLIFVVGAWLLLTSTGCGTSFMTDTTRTATEQLLITDAIDRAINQIDFDVLSGKEVFFDPQYLKNSVDQGYLESSIRQHLLASGCVLREKREDAIYVVEARAGAVGTDRNQVLFGVPQLNLPAIAGSPVTLPQTVPEIALAKDTKQKAVTKVAVFAYNRITGNPVWQSGLAVASSDAKNSWLLGIGPFQKGSIYDGTDFAGGKLDLPIIGSESHVAGEHTDIPITSTAIFPDFDRRQVVIDGSEETDNRPAHSNAPARVAVEPSPTELPASARPAPSVLR